MSTKSVLFVDDDSQDMRDVFSEILQSAGLEVSTAENGQVAWEMIQEHNYDLILSDVDMPVLNGIELAKRVRLTRPDIPVILITGRGYEALDEVKRLVPQGIVKQVFSKPIQLREVVEIVWKTLS